MTNPDLFGYGFATLTRELRSRAWEAAADRNPALKATALDPLIMDLDATLVTSHSDKEQAVGTYKGGYGFAPFIASVDYGTGNEGGEILAALLRPGNAGAHSAEDQSQNPIPLGLKQSNASAVVSCLTYFWFLAEYPSHCRLGISPCTP